MQYCLTEGLEGVERLQYRGAKSFNKTIDKLITEFQPGGAAAYVVFSPVTQEQLADIDRIRQRRFKGLRFMYLNDESTLIIKVIVDLTQELAHRQFVRRFERKTFEMGIDMELVPLGAARFLGLFFTISKAVGQPYF